MKFLSFVIALTVGVTNLVAQCELKVSLDANPDLKICAGGYHTLKPSTNLQSSFQWYKDGKAVVLPFPEQFIVSEPGVYKVKATSLLDPGCTAVSKEVVVSTIVVPAVSISSSSPSFCQGDTVKLQTELQSSSGWAVQWYKNDVLIPNAVGASTTVSSGGNYSVRIQQAECSSYSPAVFIKELPKPKADFEFSVTNQNGINFTNTSDGGVSFTWSFGDGKASELVNPSHIYGKAGQYKIELTAKAANGCTDVITKSLSVGSTTTSVVDQSQLAVTIFPNPTSGLLTIQSETDLSGGAVDIFDLQGKLLERQVIGANGSVDLSALDSGIYILSLRMSTAQLTQKVTKI